MPKALLLIAIIIMHFPLAAAEACNLHKNAFALVSGNVISYEDVGSAIQVSVFRLEEGAPASVEKTRICRSADNKSSDQSGYCTNILKNFREWRATGSSFLNPLSDAGIIVWRENEVIELNALDGTFSRFPLNADVSRLLGASPADTRALRPLSIPSWVQTASIIGRIQTIHAPDKWYDVLDETNRFAMRVFHDWPRTSSLDIDQTGLPFIRSLIDPHNQNYSIEVYSDDTWRTITELPAKDGVPVFFGIDGAPRTSLVASYQRVKENPWTIQFTVHSENTGRQSFWEAYSGVSVSRIVHSPKWSDILWLVEGETTIFSPTFPRLERVLRTLQEYGIRDVQLIDTDRDTKHGLFSGTHKQSRIVFEVYRHTEDAFFDVSLICRDSP